MIPWSRLWDSRWARLGAQVAAGVIVLGVVVAGAWGFYRARETRGSAALASAMALLPADGQPVTPESRAAAIKALEGVLAEYPRVSAAAQAAYELGNLKYAVGRYAEARNAYSIALGRGATGTVAILAQLGIGYCWEAEQKYGEAATAYQTALQRLGPKDFAFEEALMAEARAEELAGKPAVALELYRRLVRDVPDTRRADDVRSRIASLQGRVTQ